MKTNLIISAVVAVGLGVAVGWYAPRQSAAAITNAPALTSDALTGQTATTNRVAVDKKILYYACPMHPNIHYDHPGICPICGMKLEPVYASENGTNAPALPSCCSGGGCQ